MSMPPAKPSPHTCYRGVRMHDLFYCMAVLRSWIFLVDEYNYDDLAVAVCTVTSCMIVELICPACYSLCSLGVPVMLAVHAITVHENAMITAWQVVLLMPMTVFFIGIPMSICLHRYFSHEAFATSRVVQLVLAITSTLAYQGGPLWWASLHIRHHKNCDKEDDPHSLVREGFWYAFLGWMVCPANYRVDYSTLPAAHRTLEIRCVQKLHMLFPVLLCLIARHSFGYGVMLWSVLVPMLLCRLITCLFNLEFHPVESERNCKAIDDDRFLAKIVGESCHKDHHANPRRSRRPDWDLSHRATLSWMQALGLVWDCR